ncbi:MAG: M28 family peptidase [Candidatus Krumholzibacteria bacterium]|nr:M28 family peptidase [Candidatus Krumholzibacteria bacterium]
MKRYLMTAAAALAVALSSCTMESGSPPPGRRSGGGPLRTVSRREIQSVVELLSSDLLEGRAPGTRGGELAEEYMRSLFKQFDMEPYEGDYFQQFTLRGFTTLDLVVQANGVRLAFLDDAVGSFVRDGASFSLGGQAVFVGYGIAADAWSWDDYKGADVSGKIVICRVNEPGPGDTGLFEGDALTYYGRWTYKIEEAARRGARGILLVHTDDTAGYGWHVVRNSWGGEELYLPSQIEDGCEFRGWVREKKLREILSAVGRDLGELCEASERRDFEPVDLGFAVTITGRGESRSLIARNVVGVIPGADPLLREKSIVLSAHIDHLGMNESLPGDDRIFNGAIDNGAAVAAMAMTAKLLGERREELHYSVIVLACQAEEAGLLGSRHFAETIDPGSVVCNINFESTPVWGPSRSILGVGAEYSTLERTLELVASDLGLGYSMFSMADRGFFYRSDQFSFARRGIPAVWISAGEDFEDGFNHALEFFTGAYHTVDDEYDPLWELASTRQTIEAAVLLALRIDRETARPAWKRALPFPVDQGGE